MARNCSIKDRELTCNLPADELYDKTDVKSANRRVDTDKPYSLSRGHGAYDNTKKAIDNLGGMCKFVKKGDLVAIKANMTGGSPGLTQTFTNRDVLSSIVDQVRDCGGNPVVYDSSMVWTKMEPIAMKAGFMDWGQDNNVPVVDIFKENKVKFNYGHPIKEDEASQLLVDADVIINAPVAKTHIMTGVTIGLKNMYGSLPIMDKAKYHAQGINEVIAEVNNTFTPTLTVVDMTEGCDGGGPLVCRSMNPPPDTIIASTDTVCADSVAASIMGHGDVRKITHIKKAEELGLGDPDCGNGIKEELDDPHYKDGAWHIVHDSDGLAGLITGMFEEVMKWPPMIPFVDAAADFWLGWLHWTFKNGMANLWDYVINKADEYNVKQGNYENPEPWNGSGATKSKI